MLRPRYIYTTFQLPLFERNIGRLLGIIKLVMLISNTIEKELAH